MEAIFPDKKVYVHTVSFINLLVQAFTAFFAAIATLWRVGEEIPKGWLQHVRRV
jgi:hypothetical protein